MLGARRAPPTDPRWVTRAYLARRCPNRRRPGAHSWEPGPGGIASRVFLTRPRRVDCVRMQCLHERRVHARMPPLDVLEQKTDLGLAAPPSDVARPRDDDELVAPGARRAREARQDGADEASRRRDSSKPWTDYTCHERDQRQDVPRRASQRGSRRVVLLMPRLQDEHARTCKHIMKVLARTTKAFPKSILKKPYRRRRITVHLRYEDRVSLAVALPLRLLPKLRAIVAPLLRGRSSQQSSCAGCSSSKREDTRSSSHPTPRS